MSEKLFMPKKQDELQSAVELAQHTVYKRYLSELNRYPVAELSSAMNVETADDCLRISKIEQLSLTKDEDFIQKLATVYHTGMSLGCGTFIIIDVDRLNGPANFYIGIRNSEGNERKTEFNISAKAIHDVLESNFPGSTLYNMGRENSQKMIDEMFGDHITSIASVSCVAAARDKSKTENKSFIQGIERLIDTMEGKPYTAIIIAEPISQQERADIRAGYESLYSTLYSFKKRVLSYSENESHSVTESLTNGISSAITQGTAHTQSHTINAGINVGINRGMSRSTAISDTTANGSTKAALSSKIGQSLGAATGIASAFYTAAKTVSVAGRVVSAINPAVGAAFSVVGGLGGLMSGNSSNQSTSHTVSNINGSSTGVGAGFNAGYARTNGDTESNSETRSTSESKTHGTTDTTGSTKALQVEFADKTVEELLKRLEEQLKRLQQSEDYGAYSCAAYFMSSREQNTLTAANTYHALMLGEGSFAENGAINHWVRLSENENNTTKSCFSEIKEYLKRMEHPVFLLPVSLNKNGETECIPYTAGTMVSGLELPLHMGLPTRSVYGLPVVEHAEFGRSVFKLGANESNGKMEIPIGKLYNMGQEETQETIPDFV